MIRSLTAPPRILPLADAAGSLSPADDARQQLAAGDISLQEARTIIEGHLSKVATDGSAAEKQRLQDLVQKWRQEVNTRVKHRLGRSLSSS